MRKIIIALKISIVRPIFTSETPALSGNAGGRRVALSGDQIRASETQSRPRVSPELSPPPPRHRWASHSAFPSPQSLLRRCVFSRAAVTSPHARAASDHPRAVPEAGSPKSSGGQGWLLPQAQREPLPRLCSALGVPCRCVTPIPVSTWDSFLCVSTLCPLASVLTRAQSFDAGDRPESRVMSS